MLAPGFFATMQIPILRGREIENRDGPGSPEVAVVSEQFARKNFSDENPIGRRFVMARRAPRDMEIVGVAREARYGGLKREVSPVVYMPYSQGAQRIVAGMTFYLRTSGDPLSYANAVREIVHQADARVPVISVKTQAAQIDDTISREIAFAKLGAEFAILALTIACVGLYGTLCCNVARRTNEIGIRMALAARGNSQIDEKTCDLGNVLIVSKTWRWDDGSESGSRICGSRRAMWWRRQPMHSMTG